MTLRSTLNILNWPSMLESISSRWSGTATPSILGFTYGALAPFSDVINRFLYRLLFIDDATTAKGI